MTTFGDSWIALVTENGSMTNFNGTVWVRASKIQIVPVTCDPVAAVRSADVREAASKAKMVFHSSRF